MLGTSQTLVSNWLPSSTHLLCHWETLVHVWVSAVEFELHTTPHPDSIRVPLLYSCKEEIQFVPFLVCLYHCLTSEQHLSSFYMTSCKDTAGHTNAFDYPVMDHWGKVRVVSFRSEVDANRRLVWVYSSSCYPLHHQDPQKYSRSVGLLIRYIAWHVFTTGHHGYEWNHLSNINVHALLTVKHYIIL